MALLLGLDLGTSAVKGLLCDETGWVVASADHPITLLRPQPGWVVQDVQQLWQTIVAVVRRIAAQVPQVQEVVALSLSVASGNTLLLDADGQPLGPAVHWMDCRAEPQIRQLLPHIDPEEDYRITGWALSGMSPLGHLAWLRRYDPERIAAACRFCMTNDWILHRLCGRYAMDPSNASTSGLYDQIAEHWHSPYLETLTMAEGMFSPLVPSGQALGTLTPLAAGELRLSTDTLVVNGAHDQVCAALGAGVLRPGEVLLSCGTAWVILFPAVDRTAAMAVAELVDPHVLPGLWAAMTSLYGLGLAPTWYLDLLRAGAGTPDTPIDTLYRVLNEGAASAPPGANGIVFSPLEGGRAPFGALLYLGPRHTHGDVSRALMEGAAYETRIQLERIRDSGLPLDSIKAVGGAMESPVWPHVAADVCGRCITLVGGQSTAARGAAILAGLGAGLFADPMSGAAAMAGEQRLVEPQPDHVRTYDELFGKYVRTVGLLDSLV